MLTFIIRLITLYFIIFIYVIIYTCKITIIIPHKKIYSSVRRSGTISHKHLTFCSEHYISICYLCAMRSAKFRKIRIQNTRLRALFKTYELFWKVMCTEGAAQSFNWFQICSLPRPALWSNIYFVGDIIALAIYLLY